MARKKQEEEKGVEAGWMNTFADLMNLLLCFFVLLFSMSTVDADKYEQLVTSMTESINIFDKGGSSIGDGAFVSSGTDQLISVEQYFNEYENPGESTKAEPDESKRTDVDGNPQPNDSPDEDLSNAEKQYQAKKAAEQKAKVDELYGRVNDDANRQNVEDKININIDKDNQYVQISLNGALLFDTGEVDIKKSVLPLMSKVGDILKQYSTHRIKIEGHTDNVPVSGKYRNNMLLSTARANSVFEYLKDIKKISPKSMETSGFGEYKPVATNKTAKGRAQNRRVEIKIYTDK